MRLFPFIDLVFNGEADVSFPEALERLGARKTLAGLKGVAFRSNGKVIEQGWGDPADLDAIPSPDFTGFVEDVKRLAPEAVDAGRAHLLVEFSRGCWWAEKSMCIFCASDVGGSNRFRSKKPEKALSELREMAAVPGIAAVRVADSMVCEDYFDSLFPTLAEDPVIELHTIFVRAHQSRERLRLLRAAGVPAIHPGIESLDTGVLRLMRKGTNMLQVVSLLKWAREYGLQVYWHILYGTPGETAEAYQGMAALIPSLCHLAPPFICAPLEMHRFSPLFDETKKETLEPVAMARAIYPFDDEDIMDISICFEWDYRTSAAPEGSIKLCLVEAEKWIDAWKKEPPLLVFQRQGDATLKVYDTRAASKQRVRVLDPLASAVCLICDDATSFEGIARALGEKMDDYPGEAALRGCLDGLVGGRLMVSENGRYLCLANDLDVMKRHCPQFGVQMLGMGF